MSAHLTSHPAPHSALLALRFSLLQQVVQRHLLPDGQPLELRFDSADGLQRHQTLLAGCLVQPAPDNRCLLVFQFSKVRTTSCTDASAQDVELAFVVDLVAQSPDHGPGAFLTFDYHLTFQGQGILAWPGYGEVLPETKRAFLRELENVVYSRLRFNLCQLPEATLLVQDPLVLANAVVVEVAVVATEPAQLCIYYAAPGKHHYSPPPEHQPPLPPDSNVGLFVGNEHLLRTLVLPALQPLYHDYRTEEASEVSPADFGNYFHIRPAQGEDTLANIATLRASNTVPLLPRQTAPGAQAMGLVHVVNKGDLTIEIDDRVRVSIIYTVILQPQEQQKPNMAIKIRQTYAFRLTLSGDPYNIGFEASSLDMWGETSAPDMISFFAPIIKQFAYNWLGEIIKMGILSIALRYVTNYARQNGIENRGILATISVLVADALTKGYRFIIHQVAHLELFEATSVPNDLLPPTNHDALPSPAPPNTDPPVDGVVPQVLTIELAQTPDLLKLNQLLAKLLTSEDSHVEFSRRFFYSYRFYQSLVRNALFSYWQEEHPVANLLYNYQSYVVKHCLQIEGSLRKEVMHAVGVHATANALLARQFFGPDYAEGVLRQDETRRGLQQALSTTFLPLFNRNEHNKHTKLQAVRALPHGLQLLFHVDADRLQTVARPIKPRPADKQVPRQQVLQEAVAAQQRIAQTLAKRFELDFAELNAGFDDFFAMPDRPNGPEQLVAAIEQQMAQTQQQALDRLKKQQDRWFMLLRSRANDSGTLEKYNDLLNGAHLAGAQMVRQQLLIVKNVSIICSLYLDWWKSEGVFYHPLASELLKAQEALVKHWNDSYLELDNPNADYRLHLDLLQKLEKEADRLKDEAQEMGQSLHRALEGSKSEYMLHSSLHWSLDTLDFLP